MIALMFFWRKKDRTEFLYKVGIYFVTRKKRGRNDDSIMEVIERISVLEGKVSEHDRIFDMIREEIRELREYRWKDRRYEHEDRRLEVEYE